MKLRPGRRICSQCRCHKAISFASGHAAWRRDHPLCPACFGRLREQVRAREIASRIAASLPVARVAA